LLGKPIELSVELDENSFQQSSISGSYDIGARENMNESNPFLSAEMQHEKLKESDLIVNSRSDIN
jgi:hypothetical protein